MHENFYFLILLEILNHPCTEEMYKGDIRKIYRLIENNQCKKLEEYLEKDKSIVKRLFFYSISLENTESSLIILKHINNVNETFYFDNCYLQASTQFDNIEVTKKLLELGANPNPCGQHPLTNALFHKNEEMINLLLEKGSRIEFLYNYVNQTSENVFERMIKTATLENLYFLKRILTSEQRKEKTQKKIEGGLIPLEKYVNNDALRKIEEFLSYN